MQQHHYYFKITQTNGVHQLRMASNGMLSGLADKIPSIYWSGGGTSAIAEPLMPHQAWVPLPSPVPSLCVGYHHPQACLSHARKVNRRRSLPILGKEVSRKDSSGGHTGLALLQQCVIPLGFEDEAMEPMLVSTTMLF